MSQASSQIAKQAQTDYQNYQKIKGFEDVGYFLENYVVSGGEVTKNLSRNDQIDVSTIVVVLNNDVTERDGTTLTLKTANATYYLDFINGDFWLDTVHPSGVAGTDYLTVSEIVTDADGNVSTITDKRGEVGGFRLKSDFWIGQLALNTKGYLQSALKQMKKGDLFTIVCMGDSITYGQDSELGSQATTTYPSHLQTLLREFYQNDNITVVNSGVSGNTTSQMIARWQTDVTDHNPDLILFNGGTNDAREANNVSVEEYAANLKTIISLVGETPMVALGITPRFKEQETANGEGVIQFYREACQQIFTKYGFVYIDMFENIMNLYKNRGMVRGLVSPDGSHYTPEGYKHFAEIVFTFGLVNDDITIKSDQFKDIAGQWIVTSATASDWGGAVLIDKNAIVISASSITLFLYLQETSYADLVTHFVMDRTNGTNQNVDIVNTDFSDGVAVNYTTSPSAPSTLYYNDYPVPVAKLKPGLNRISFTTSTSVRMNGFSVLPRQPVGYQEAAYDSYQFSYWTSKDTNYNSSTQGYEVLDKGITAVSNVATKEYAYFDIVPDVGETTRYRFRGTFIVDSFITFGQQSTDVNYARVYKLTFDGTNAILTAYFDAQDVEVSLATVAVVVAAGGTDLKIDISSDQQSWSIWVNDTLIYTETIPLSIGPVTIGNDNLSNRVLMNPPIKKGKNASDTGILVGEEWYTFSDDKLHIVNAAATEKTLTFV